MCSMFMAFATPQWGCVETPCQGVSTAYQQSTNGYFLTVGRVGTGVDIHRRKSALSPGCLPTAKSSALSLNHGDFVKSSRNPPAAQLWVLPTLGWRLMADL
jgi:hypothetical protein